MCITDYVSLLSANLFVGGRYRKSQAYVSLLNSISGFHSHPSLSLKTVFTHGFLHDYEAYLIRRECRPNSISFYMNALRSIYGMAIASGYLSSVSGLFDGVFTGTEQTEKRAVAPGVIARILTGDLSGKARLEPCRDYLLLSLQLQGMSFIDLAHLRKCDIQGGVVSYRRRKTGTAVQVALLPDARVIFDKYADQVKDSPYLLPLITLEGADGYRQYQSALHRQNTHLKELAVHLGIRENLTTYTSRHTWATLAYHNGIEVGVVSQGMGHHTEEVTRFYLASFAQERLLAANYTVLSAIFRPVLEGEIKDVLPETMARVKQQAKVAADYLTGSKEINLSPQLKALDFAKVNVGKGGGGQRTKAGRGNGRVW